VLLTRVLKKGSKEHFQENVSCCPTVSVLSRVTTRTAYDFAGSHALHHVPAGAATLCCERLVADDDTGVIRVQRRRLANLDQALPEGVMIQCTQPSGDRATDTAGSACHPTDLEFGEKKPGENGM
jgi:hypothetical protein